MHLLGALPRPTSQSTQPSQALQPPRSQHPPPLCARTPSGPCLGTFALALSLPGPNFPASLAGRWGHGAESLANGGSQALHSQGPHWLDRQDLEMMGPQTQKPGHCRVRRRPAPPRNSRDGLWVRHTCGLSSVAEPGPVCYSSELASFPDTCAQTSAELHLGPHPKGTQWRSMTEGPLTPLLSQRTPSSLGVQGRWHQGCPVAP